MSVWSGGMLLIEYHATTFSMTASVGFLNQLGTRSHRAKLGDALKMHMTESDLSSIWDYQIYKNCATDISSLK